MPASLAAITMPKTVPRLKTRKWRRVSQLLANKILQCSSSRPSKITRYYRVSNMLESSQSRRRSLRRQEQSSTRSSSRLVPIDMKPRSSKKPTDKKLSTQNRGEENEGASLTCCDLLNFVRE